MKSTNVINVFYHNRSVGRIAVTSDGLCAFEYDAEWLRDGFSVSPFKLPLEKRVFIATRDPFDGNFGVFNDSLPDGWGRLLIDRMLIKQRINPATLSVLDRLAIVGTSGMGALEYRPENILANTTEVSNLDKLANQCAKILNDEYDDNLEQLVKLGGSSGGARPKVLIKYNNEDWMVKFPSSDDPKDIGIKEYDYSVMAKNAGLIMPDTKLFNDKYFGVKRFDRKPDGTKVHMLSASALLNTSHCVPALDYTELLKATHLLIRDYRELLKMFRLMCFNVFAHNRDDHSKNFAFLYDDGKWIVSPAYDLVYSNGPGGEHTTMVAGVGKNPTETDILNVADAVGITQKDAKQIIDEVKNAVKL
jgi:serine/threonine-protein kinase HipA